MLLKPFTALSFTFQLLFFSIFILCSTNLKGQLPLPEKVGFWENVQGFTINQDENYMVISVMVIGRSQLYETYLENGSWSELKPLESINRHHGEGFNIDGPSLNYNGRFLYFHANFPDSKGGYDIYYSEKGSNGWGSPVNVGFPINSAEDDLYPSITPGENRFFFSRGKNDEELKKPKETPQCQHILMSIKTLSGTWGEPIFLHDGINKGCEFGPSICNDGKSLFFSSVDQENSSNGYDLYFTREILMDNWLVPNKLESSISEHSDINPIFVSGQVYFLRKWKARKLDFGSIFKIAVPESFHPLKTITSTGKLVSQENGLPIDAKLTVFEPTTLAILGTFYSDKQTGIFELPLLDGYNYIVDVRKHGYSFASFMIDYRSEQKKHAPERIELFEKIDLLVSIYDNEIFRPLNAEVSIKNLKQPSQIFKGQMVEPGIYSFSLPLGFDYSVIASAEWFAENSFQFDLSGDVIFSRFERNLPLEPKKRPVEIQIADSETEEGLAAEVVIRNLNRDETIIFSAEDVKNGKVTAMLREGDEYEFTIRGAQGYSFHNQVVDMSEKETTAVSAELIPLKAQTSIRLNNINFGTNSAELASESFPELDRVVTLILDNPNIVIEIAAHSDNVGSASYNKLLSDRRAQSVVNYLLDFDVPKERIVAKGYGMSKPMVPNNSEENRALNRRVEFKIIDIMEENSPNDGANNQ